MITPVLLHGWSNVESLYEDFERKSWCEPEQDITDKDDIEILFGSYTYENYSGRAFVLFRRQSDGKLYEVNGSHCSCYGLEGQWNPEECTVAHLRHRLSAEFFGRDYDGANEFADELTALLDELEAMSA